MPMRELMIDGKLCRMMITNVHPDGTEFLPEEFEITGRNEQERNILRFALSMSEKVLECRLKEQENEAK